MLSQQILNLSLIWRFSGSGFCSRISLRHRGRTHIQRCYWCISRWFWCCRWWFIVSDNISEVLLLVFTLVVPDSAHKYLFSSQYRLKAVWQLSWLFEGTNGWKSSSSWSILGGEKRLIITRHFTIWSEFWVELEFFNMSAHLVWLYKCRLGCWVILKIWLLCLQSLKWFAVTVAL